MFVDIRPDTMNIDETKIEEAITEKTKAIVPVHYAGVSCAMDEIMAIAKKYNLKVVEDAAQGVNAFYKGKALGTIGDFECYSFHETKNFTMGEGGALLFQKEEYLEKSIQRLESITQQGYYARMAVAWAISIYFVAFPGEMLDYLQHSHKLDEFTYKKSLQKILESYRVDKETKQIIKEMRQRG